MHKQPGSNAGLIGLVLSFALSACNCHEPRWLIGVPQEEVAPPEELPLEPLVEADAGLPCLDQDRDGVGVGPGCSGATDCDDQDPFLGSEGTRACYTGPVDTGSLGACTSGIETCTAGVLGPCEGEVTPAAEVCDDLDNDCDGETDEALALSCYTGPEGTLGLGQCRGGTRVCAGGLYGVCAGELTPTAEVCDGLDNDCDGEVDEAVVRSCYSGPAGTSAMGACKAGIQLCVGGAFGSCLGEVTPSAERCDSVDNDCDGAVDGISRSCYSGPLGTLQVGACAAGVQTCSAGAFGACVGEVTPSAETCDSRDNDCDGAVDEALARSCYTGPAPTRDVGLCRAGSQSCSAGVFGDCLGEVVPSAEACDNQDNDCDGAVDEALARSCYSGPPGTPGVGLCLAGTQSCNAGVYGACAGEVKPSAESCDNLDNDCDGSTDEELARSCYSGPPGTQGVGVCLAGTQTCNAGAYGACAGERTPAAELCDNQDNDCNGAVDENLTRSCYSGPPGTQGIGLCLSGTQTCNAGVYGICAGERTPDAELCDNLDNDCDGTVDEALTRVCYSGPSGTRDVGLCRAGSQSCSAGAFGDCLSEVVPSGEGCDGQDNDCDGAVDEALTRSCYSGPAGTQGIGLCSAGTQACVGGSYAACLGEVKPSAESCDNLDNDCDGSTDEALSRACYSGPAGTEAVGVCRAGAETCVAGAFGACAGEVKPSAEGCDNLDNDCDGSTDEALSQACYSGPAGTANVGLCVGGSQRCSAGAWGACAGEVTPSAETCDNLDSDCDGSTDEELSRACYSGPAGTANVGICRSGSELCAAGAWGACQGEVLPLPEEHCATSRDENCDGQVDELFCKAFGVYVCNSCPGASDTNPGTPDFPVLTIRRGIELAVSQRFDLVFVANRDDSTANVYPEEVIMAEGVSVQGRWVQGRPWTRSSTVRTLIHDTTPSGVKFPPGLTRFTVLDGFWVRASGAVGAATSSAAVTISQSSPTLRDVWAGELVPGAKVPSSSVGIEVAGVAGSPANPRLEGLDEDRRGRAHGGTATASSTGIRASFAKLDVQYLEALGGQAGSAGTSRGAWLTDSPNSWIRDSRVLGGNAGDCIGVAASQEVSGIVVERSWISGCEPGGNVAPNRGAGVLFSACASSAGTAPVVRLNPSISGAVVPGGVALGVGATDGCPLWVEDNPNISGGSQGDLVVGVLCSNQSWQRSDGADSACIIRRNTIYGALTSLVADSRGVSCEGSCLGKGASCAGSCAEVSQNLISATAGVGLVHLNVVHSSPPIWRNNIGLGSAGVACVHQTQVAGLSLRGSSSRVENNFVQGGPCETVWGLLQINERRADGSWPAPDVHSNTLVGGGSSANTTGSESYGIALRTTGGGSPPALGSYRNNIVVGGQNNHRFSVDEEDGSSDPATFWNNDLFNFTRPSGPNPVVYRDENSKDLLTAAEVNQRLAPAAQANVDLDPVFVNNYVNFHLQSVSPLRELGSSAGVPAGDIDGEARPSPAGTAPEIGADELP